MVKWSACLPSLPAIRVQIPLESIAFTMNNCLKRINEKKKRFAKAQC